MTETVSVRGQMIQEREPAWAWQVLVVSVVSVVLSVPSVVPSAGFSVVLSVESGSVVPSAD